jgi:hypothetical protein
MKELGEAPFYGKKSGIAKKSPTIPYTGVADADRVIGEAKKLKDVSDLLSQQKPDKPIPFKGKKTTSDAKVGISQYGGGTFGRVPIDVTQKISPTIESYFDKLAPSLVGQRLPELAQKAEQYAPAFVRQLISPAIGRGASATSVKESQDLPKKPVRTVSTPEELQQFLQEYPQYQPYLAPKILNSQQLQPNNRLELNITPEDWKKYKGTN